MRAGVTIACDTDELLSSMNGLPSSQSTQLCTTYWIFPVKLFLLTGNCFLEALTLKNGKKQPLTLAGGWLVLGWWLVVDSGSSLAPENILF